MSKQINKEQLGRAVGIKQNKITTFFVQDGIVYYSVNNVTKLKRISTDDVIKVVY